MKILLDTHAFLWFITGDANLSDKARTSIEDDSNQMIISMASMWEMAIKISIGRLKVSEPFELLIPSQIQINGFELLPIQLEHVYKVSSLPFHHRDPFDRLLVSQCMVEKCPIISRDSAFDRYQVKRLW
jgi:PIN domain nuclease of toxin-antitoxin system